MKSHFLYRLFDEAGELLYIGITNNPEYRLEQHALSKPWFSKVAEVKLESDFNSREELEDAERAAILAEIPLYNSVHNNNWHKKHKPSPPSERAIEAMERLGEFLFPDGFPGATTDEPRSA